MISKDRCRVMKWSWVSMFVAMAMAGAALPPLERTAGDAGGAVDDLGIALLDTQPPYDDGTYASTDAIDPGFGWRVADDQRRETLQGCDIIPLDPNEAPYSFYIDLQVSLDVLYAIDDVYGYQMAPPINPLEPYIRCVDYYGHLDEPSRQLQVSFHREGIYVVCTSDAQGAFTFYTVAAGAPRGGSGRGPQRDGVPKLLQAQHLPRELQMFDLVLVEKPAGGDNGFDAAAFSNFRLVRAPIKRIQSVQEGVDEIAARSAELRRPINVIIAGHGSGGTVGMGSGQGQGNNEQDKEFIGVGSEKNQIFVRGTRGKIKGLYMFGCNVATAGGTQAMQKLADALVTPDNPIVVVAGHNRLVAAWTAAGNRPGGLYVYGDRRNQCDITATVKRGE